MRNLLKYIVVSFLFISILILPPKIFAQQPNSPSDSKILINEVFPAPDTKSVEYPNEFIELITNKEISPGEYYFEDESGNVKDIDTFTVREDSNDEYYILYEISGYFLNNDEDRLFLKKVADDSVIDEFCYSDNENYCANDLRAEKTKSLSRFIEADEVFFESISPTPGKENISIFLNFELKDESEISKTRFSKGKIIKIEDKSKIFGIKNESLTWSLDSRSIDDLEIDTKKLKIGTHVIKCKTSIGGEDIEIEKAFEITEDFNGLEISEVFPNPKGEDIAGENEWIEIHNTTDREIDLLNLVIQKIKINLEKTDIAKKVNFVIDENYLLKPNEHKIIKPSFTLTNNEGSLRLTDKEGNVIDAISYSDPVKENESIILYENDIKITTTPTPDKKNLFTEKNEKEVKQNKSSDPPNSQVDEETKPVPKFNGLKITRILANPEGKDIKGENEWIEVMNNSNKDLNLKNLIVVQETATKYSFEFTEEKILKPKESYKLYPDFSINNSSATMSLGNSEEEVFDSINYNDTIKDDEILIRKETSNEMIVLEKEEKEEERQGEVLSSVITDPTVIHKAKELKEKSETLVKGSVTVEPNILEEDVFYIQDETGGIRIDAKDNPTPVTLGEIVEVHGETDSYHSEKEIEVSDKSIHRTNQAHVILPKSIPINEIGKDTIGSLITIEGTVTKTSGNTFFVNDGTGELKVHIKESTGIDRPDCRKGYYAEITGILSVWDKKENGEPNYRLLPRYQEDVFISETLANTGGNNLPVFSLGIFICIIGIFSIRLSCFKQSLKQIFTRSLPRTDNNFIRF